jgi:Spy/CpxP family protein refolding chaperone
MVRQFSRMLSVAVLLMAAPAFAECLPQDGRDQRTPAATQQRPRPKFWQVPTLRQERGITDQESAALEQSFSSSIQMLRDARKDLDALEAVLSRTIQENTADLITVSQQVDKVEAARSAYNKARTLMLYRMNLVLSVEQRAKVKAMNARYEEQRRKDEDDRRKHDSGRQ